MKRLFGSQLFLVCLMFSLVTLGCGAEQVHQSAESQISYMNQQQLASADSTADAVDETGVAADAVIPKHDRRIIYSTDLSVVVMSLFEFDQQLNALVEQQGGFIANSNFEGLQRSNNRGTWTARIPVLQHDHFVAAIGKLGTVESKQQTASDVSDEFVDLESRIKNKKRLEERIAELIDKRKDSLPEMIKVEYELSRVREEIERMQGRMNFLNDRTSLATVSIRVRQQDTPVAIALVPFKTQIGNAWQAAVDESTSLIQAVTIFLARYSLTMVSLLVLATLILLLVRPVIFRLWRIMNVT